jgi:molybdenum cofactor cytidylyltransferase
LALGRAGGDASVDLLAALEVRPGERIALVGGGGKTGLAGRLVAEARQRGWTAVFTTTTRVLAPAADDATLLITEGAADPAPLRQRLQQQGRLFLARGWLPEWEQTPAGRQQKVGGFSPQEIACLAAALAPDLLVVEADGSRHRPFKAPAPYEPVVPAGTTLLAVLAGLSVLGQPLDEPWVHRPERAAELAAVPLGTPVDVDLLAAVLAHPRGGRQGAPPEARAVAVLTQATPERLPAGRRLARRLLRAGGFGRVLLVDLDDPAAAGEVWQSDATGDVRVGLGGLSQVHIVVLAAGRSQRMGQNKLLLPLGGKPLLAHAVDAALGSPAAAVWVVLGAGAEALRQALGTRPLWFLENRCWPEGQSASIRAAVEALPASAGGVLFLAGDMPLVPVAHLDRLIERWRGGVTVVWSGDGAVRRIPALFGREAFPALLGLAGDMGGRALAGLFSEETVPVASGRFLFDIDTMEAYEQARRLLEEC